MPSPTSRSILTVLLFIHLFVVVLVLSAAPAKVWNAQPSLFHARVMRVLAPYAQPLNLDFPNSQYHLTHATSEDVDHQIQVLPEDQDADDESQWRILPDVGYRGGERYKRYQRLADFFAREAANEADDVTALIAQSVATHLLHEEELQPVQLRCRKLMLRSWRDRAEQVGRDTADDDTYRRTAYDANLVVSGDGRVEPVKIVAAEESAQARPEGE